MDQLISKIESYSRAMAEKVAGDFFSHFESISGDQILKITPIEQVNLFVIRNLLQKWKEESGKLKSPYFDYENAEVKSALDNFMVTLSKNISVKKEFFKPLLQKAINDSLLFLLKPDYFFQQEFNNKVTFQLSEIKEFKKYSRIGRENLDTVIKELEPEGKEAFSSSVILEKFKIVFQKDPVTEEQKQQVLSHFSTMLPFDIQESVNEKEPKTVQNTFKPVSVVAPKTDSEVKESKILNEKFTGSQLTLNDVLRSADSVSLAEKIGKSKVQNIREVISLNQKFMFITTLFQGERTEYENALNQIERSNSYEEAFQFLEDTYAAKYHWESGKPELLELKELIYRKFS